MLSPVRNQRTVLVCSQTIRQSETAFFPFATACPTKVVSASPQPPNSCLLPTAGCCQTHTTLPDFCGQLGCTSHKPTLCCGFLSLELSRVSVRGSSLVQNQQITQSLDAEPIILVLPTILSQKPSSGRWIHLTASGIHFV